MNLIDTDVAKGKLKQWAGQLRERWGRVVGDEASRCAGQAQLFAGLLQERCGRNRERAAAEVGAFLASCAAAPTATDAPRAVFDHPPTADARRPFRAAALCGKVVS
jgi:uncharacterized protein YjbJ (UPF0337 family)